MDLTKMVSKTIGIDSGVDADASGSLELARWLLKPLCPSATQIHEPKKKVMLSSSMVVELTVAIEFIGGLW